jgi:hypothetical protein
MGNQQSINNTGKDREPGQIIDYIATHYILTMDFQSLTKLYKKEYCDNLVVLTSDIIDKYFNPLEISYLAKRIKNGVEVNEITKDKIIFFNKNTIDNLNLQNPLKKKRICIGIAKFYIKIAHIFSAIVMTINPVYVYKDTYGQVMKVPIYKKNEIPPNVPRKIHKLNICQTRIHSLNRGQDQDQEQEENKTQHKDNEMNIHPNICSFDVNNDTLINEPGIPELMQLYYDNNYDYTTGKFMGMSEKSKKDYEKDLLIFYNVFTGNTSATLPSDIKTFKDIKLRNYHNTPDCQGQNPLLNQNIKGSVSNKLFSQYADNVKKMVKNANDNQKALLEIINKLFIYTVASPNTEKEIRINPQLNEDNLQEIVVMTRNLIMKLYITCEIDYTNGIKIYEAIIEEKILETSHNQITYLNKLSDNLRES